MLPLKKFNSNSRRETASQEDVIYGSSRKAVAHGISNGLGSVPSAQLGLKIGNVAFDGAQTEHEIRGNLLIAVSVGNQVQDFAFAARQNRYCRRQRQLQPIDHLPRRPARTLRPPPSS